MEHLDWVKGHTLWMPVLLPDMNDECWFDTRLEVRVIEDATVSKDTNVWYHNM